MARTIFYGMLIALAIGGSAQAQLHGIAVQVNEAKPVPTVAQLQTVLNPGDLVRDVLGWHRVDKKCDLHLDPARPIVIPKAMSDLYDRVRTVGGRNFVTLAFNNVHCGQATNSGAKDFPNTDFLRTEFAAYAVRVVKQVPELGGVSLWNEFTGTFKGGYTSRAPKLAAYCLLSNAVIDEIRKVDATLPIAIGATVGWNIDEYFIDLFDTYGCVGRNDPTIWLDVHPYLATMSGNKSDWDLWTQSLGRMRAHGIANKLIATEWGGPAASKWSVAHPNANYVATFEEKVMRQDPAWAATTWFQLKSDLKHPNSGLLDRAGTALTARGIEYVDAYKLP